MTTTNRFTTIFTFTMCKKNTLLFVILVDVIHNIGITSLGIKINCIFRINNSSNTFTSHFVLYLGVCGKLCGSLYPQTLSCTMLCQINTYYIL